MGEHLEMDLGFARPRARGVGMLLLLVVACGDDGVEAVASTPTADGTDAGETTSLGETGTTSIVTNASTGASESSTGEFELPEGCGDGVVVSDQYDCFYPAAFPELPGLMASPGGLQTYPIDDGGGRALWLYYSGGPMNSVGTHWAGTALEILGEPQPDGFSTTHFLHRDVDGDGLRDLLASGGDAGGVVVFLNRGFAGLDRLDRQDPAFTIFDDGAESPSYPVDPDEDGELEFLVATGFPLPDEFRLFDRTADTWSAVGAPYDMPGCGDPSRSAFADFDEDGHEDIFLFSPDGGSCEGYPKAYDPAWHRAVVLRGEPSSGLMEWVDSTPIGGLPSGLFWVLDFDGDDHLDVLFDVNDDPTSHTTLLRGRGDGTFAPGETPAFLEGFRFRRYADLDGDGDVELLLERDDEHWVVDVPFDARTVRKIGDGAWDLSTITEDLTGDGLVDLVRRDDDGRTWLMVSAP